MAHPRRIIPGETYLITRRCYQRTFRLRPSPETNAIFMYCLAFAMQKTGVLLHAACVMSNHHHLVVTDPNVLLPDFLRELHRITAKAINASQGQWENLWAAEPCNVVRLVTDRDVDDKIAYVVVNPVASGLVKNPEEWPGFLAWGAQTFPVVRPTAYFRDEGTCPPTLLLALERPPIREPDVTPAARWQDRIRGLIAAGLAAAHQTTHEEGRKFLGREAVLAASFAQRARSYEEKRGLIPTFAARLPSVRDHLRRIEMAFRRRYREVLLKWRSGERAVEFPFGTWWMGVFHAAGVGPP